MDATIFPASILIAGPDLRDRIVEAREAKTLQDREAALDALDAAVVSLIRAAQAILDTHEAADADRT